MEPRKVSGAFILTEPYHDSQQTQVNSPSNSSKVTCTGIDIATTNTSKFKTPS